MENKKIIIFGASGFIATYLIDSLLGLNCNITAIDTDDSINKHYGKKLKYFSLDIKNELSFSCIPVDSYDVVIHLAALQPANYDESHNPKDYVYTNTIGTLNILEFCRKNSIKRMIYAMSHRNTSGHWGKIDKIKENHGRSQEYVGEYSMFSISESAAQDCVMYYRSNYGLSTTTLRLPPVYGYGPHLDIFKDKKPIKTGFQTFIECAISGKPIEVWGDPNIGRDIIYVKDVVAAIICALCLSQTSEIYNISSGYELTLSEEVDTIIEVFSNKNSKIPVKFLPKKSHSIDRFVYDNSLAFTELNWKPEFNFKNMLLDYRRELESKRFDFLIDKRKKLFKK
jgi:UDP-glucose 4-epimerase